MDCWENGARDLSLRISRTRCCTPLQRWLTAAGITKKITFHCTRHSFGSLHVEMGTDMAVIQAYLGHKNITTTQIYSKIAAQQMCQVVDKITLKRKEA